MLYTNTELVKVIFFVEFAKYLVLQLVLYFFFLDVALLGSGGGSIFTFLKDMHSDVIVKVWIYFDQRLPTSLAHLPLQFFLLFLLS